MVVPVVRGSGVGAQALGQLDGWRWRGLRLLQVRAIAAGTPVFLDEQMMRPVEPLCSWFRHLAYEDKDVKMLREHSYVVRRFVHFLEWRGRGLLQATESDLIAYRAWRTQLQDKPIGNAMWAKDPVGKSALSVAGRPGPFAARSTADDPQRAYSMTPRLRRGMDIRHMTLAQYRYFRDVGLGGQVPNSEISPVFRGRALLRNRAAADLALRTGMRPAELD